MKKLFLALIAVLFMVGIAQAVSIPQSEDPTDGPSPWYLPVYNNSGSTLDAGDCVIWDFGSSTGDDDNYVTLESAGTVGTYLTAGIVAFPSSVVAGDVATIATHGIITADCPSNEAIAAGDIVYCGPSGNVTRTEGNTVSRGKGPWVLKPIGIAVAASSGGSVKIFVNGTF